MINNPSAHTYQLVSLDKIAVSNESFRFSHTLENQELTESISRWGVIQPVLLSEPCGIIGVFIKDGRFGVGIGDALATAIESILHSLFRT